MRKKRYVQLYMYNNICSGKSQPSICTPLAKHFWQKILSNRKLICLTVNLFDISVTAKVEL